MKLNVKYDDDHDIYICHKKLEPCGWGKCPKFMECILIVRFLFMLHIEKVKKEEE